MRVRVYTTTGNCTEYSNVTQVFLKDKILHIENDKGYVNFTYRHLIRWEVVYES